MRALVILILALLTFVPTPVVVPGDPFIFDPALCPSPAMLAVVVPVGGSYAGSLDVYERDGEGVVVTASKITVDSVPITIKDSTDPLGLAVIHTFNWGWAPTIDDIGLHYINVVVSDPLGAKDARTLVLLIKVNSPPVIVGCR
ncbi:MAG: hypothetical protein MUO31_06750 [Thermodesulfovibrionales bacterium]|nr:hypothetical protein [Thermodesulfovibrionales bacterium]